jgi:hypothetical protein
MCYVFGTLNVTLPIPFPVGISELLYVPARERATRTTLVLCQEMRACRGPRQRPSTHNPDGPF